MAIGLAGVLAAALLAFAVTTFHAGRGDLQFDWAAAARPPDAPILTEPMPAGEGLIALVSNGRTPLSVEASVSAWTSIDGSTWSQLSETGAISDVGRSVDVTASATDGAAGFIAAGATQLSSGGDAAPRAAIWHSLDGRNWNTAQLDSAAGAGIVAVAARPGALVALGQTRLAAEQSLPGGVPAWYSSDGEAWHRVNVDSRDPLVRVVDFDGSFVALGSGPEASVWMSSDGQSWSEVASLPGDFRPTGIAQLGDRLVAVANVDGQPAAFSTTNARTWTRAALPVGESNPGAAVAEIVEADGRLIAFGTGNPGGSPAWVSDDGLSWRQMPSGTGLPGPAVWAVALGSRLVVTVAAPTGPGLFVGTPVD